MDNKNTLKRIETLLKLANLNIGLVNLGNEKATEQRIIVKKIHKEMDKLEKTNKFWFISKEWAQFSYETGIALRRMSYYCELAQRNLKEFDDYMGIIKRS